MFSATCNECPSSVHGRLQIIRSWISLQRGSEYLTKLRCDYDTQIFIMEMAFSVNHIHPERATGMKWDFQEL